MDRPLIALAIGLDTFGTADEIILAHAEEIAEAVRMAPAGTRVRADARDDGTFLGVRAFQDPSEPNEEDEALPGDQVAYFWGAEPGATAATVVDKVRSLTVAPRH